MVLIVTVDVSRQVRSPASLTLVLAFGSASTYLMFDRIEHGGNRLGSETCGDAG